MEANFSSSIDNFWTENKSVKIFFLNHNNVVKTIEI